VGRHRRRSELGKVRHAARPAPPRGHPGMKAKEIAIVVSVAAALACPASAAAALTFARTDYALPSLTAPVRMSDIGPGYYDDGPIICDTDGSIARLVGDG